MAGKWNIGHRLLVGVTLLVIPQLAFSEIIAGDPCSPSEEHQFRRTGGPETSGTAYTLICNGSTWTRVLEFDANANVGVKQAIPKAPLHVGGELIVGETTGLDCDADRKGGLRWNTASSGMQVCNGSTWQGMTGSTGAAAAGPEGAIQFNSSSALAGSASFVYSSAGNIGIGTQSPAAKLDISGTVRVSSSLTVGNYVITPSGIAYQAADLNGFYGATHYWGTAMFRASRQVTYGVTSGHDRATITSYNGMILQAAGKTVFSSQETDGTSIATQWAQSDASSILTIRRQTKLAPANGLHEGPYLSLVNEGGTVEMKIDDGGNIRSIGGLGLGNTAVAPHAWIKAIFPDTISVIAANENSLAKLTVGTLLVNTGSSGATAEVVKGAASQTANLTEWQDSSGTALAFVNASGGFAAPAYCDTTGANCFNPASGAVAAGPEGAIQFNNSSALAGNSNFVYTSAGEVSLTSASAATRALVVRGTVSQTANLQEWQGNNGVVLSRVDSSGAVTISPSSIWSIPLTINSPGNSGVTNLQSWTKNGNQVAKIDWTENAARLTIRHIEAWDAATGLGGWKTIAINGYNGTNPSIDLSSRSILRFSDTESLVSVNNYVGISRVSGSLNAIEINNGTRGQWMPLRIGTQSASVVPFAIKGYSSQTANLTEWQDSSGTALAVFSSAGTLAIGKSTPQTALDVVGDIQYTGEIQDVSDRRLKKEIRPLEDRGSMLEQVQRVKTYSFVMKASQDDRTEFGVIAQELEEIFPELVRTATDELGTKSVNYIGLIPPLIRGMQEQQSEIRSLQQTNRQLEQQFQSLDTRLRLLEEQIAQ